MNARDAEKMGEWHKRQPRRTAKKKNRKLRHRQIRNENKGLRRLVRRFYG